MEKEEIKKGIEINDFKIEELQDAADILEAILGNEEGISYVVNQAYKELPVSKEGEEPKCERKDACYMVANVMELWNNMLNVRITKQFVELVLGPTVDMPGEPYNKAEFQAFIIKVFTTLKAFILERISRLSSVPAKS